MTCNSCPGLLAHQRKLAGCLGFGFGALQSLGLSRIWAFLVSLSVTVTFRVLGYIYIYVYIQGFFGLSFLFKGLRVLVVQGLGFLGPRGVLCFKAFGV